MPFSNYCGDQSQKLWEDGTIGTCWRTAVVSIPLFFFLLAWAIYSMLHRSNMQMSLRNVGLLDKARLFLLFCLAIEPIAYLLLVSKDTQPFEYVDSVLWTALPMGCLGTAVLLESSRLQRESLTTKLFAVLYTATKFALWLAETKDKEADKRYEHWDALVFASTVLASFLVACFARSTKKPFTKHPQRLNEPLLPTDNKQETKVSPEEEAGWFSLLTFSWMSSVMNNKQITMDDLLPLCFQDTSAQLKQRFAEALRNKKPGASLVSVLYTSGSVTPFLLAAPLKLVYDILVFFGPSYLLREFIQFIASEKSDDDPIWWQSRGFHLALALFGVAAFQTFILQIYFALVFRAGMRVRASLVTVMYDKALRLSHGQQSSAVANLVSTDAGRIQDLFAYLHVIWSSPFQIVLCMYLLSRELGLVSAGLSFAVIFVIVFGATKVLSDRTKQMNQVLMKSRDVRVKKTLEMLNSIKLIKLYGMERIFKQNISAARESELGLLRRYVILSAITKMVSAITPFIVLVSTLGSFVALGGELDPATAFVSITLLQLLRFPMNMLPNLLGGLIEGLNSLGRIEAYLNLEELHPQAMTKSEADESVAVHLRGSYTWGSSSAVGGEESKVALDNIDFVVHEGEFCIVRGGVGSGKTALLLGVLGELDAQATEAPLRVINGTVSYAGQVPWIRNASIRDNILLGEAYDEHFYFQVLDAACLMPDLAQLANGDMTDIGEKGINLSGGQKARISLARCLYSRSDILLLESVFEAVDEHVQGEIWKRAFFGLLRDQPSKSGRKRTAIVVTHCMKPETRLVDRVVRMDKAKLTVVPVEQDFAAQRTATNGVEDEEEEHAREEEAIVVPVSRSVTPGTAALTFATGGTAHAANKEPVKSLMTVETSTTSFAGNVAYKLYIYAVGGWGVIGFQLAIASLRTANDISSNRWLAHWSNDVEKGSDRELTYYMGIYAIFALLAVGLFATMFLSIYLCGLKASLQLHAKLVDSIVRAPMSFFDSTPLGRITQRFTKDLNSLDMMLPPIVITLYQVCFDAFGTVLVVAIVSPLFLFALPFMVYIYLSVKTVYVRTSRELKNLDSISLSPVFSQFSEASDGCVSIRAFGKAEEFKQHNFDKLDRNLSAYYLMTSANRWLAVRIEFIGNFLLLFASVLTASRHGSVSSAMAGMALSYTMNITQSLNWVVRTLGDFETNIVSVERISEYTDNIQQEAAEDANGKEEIPPSWPERGEIIFSNVCVRYREDLDNVLKGISFTIPAGAHVGCVGQTGCGKSTLLLALLRIVEPHSGQVLIDGVDTKSVGLERLRNAMSIIPQDAVMFQNTLRFNLDPALTKSDAELWRVLDRCELSDFIRDTFQNLDAMVSGHEFSFGQRQLFCIARALLRNSRILLSDEASSGIDRDTDAKLRRMIQQEFASVTTLTIAHRLETIAQSDLVLVLDFGKVIEFDSPRALMTNKDSKFAQLVAEMNKHQ